MEKGFKRSKLIGLRITPGEKDWLLEVCKRNGITMSALLKTGILLFLEAEKDKGSW